MPDSSLRVKLYSFLLSSFRICPPFKNDGRGRFCFSMVLHSCPSFLNEVMASEPLFEERSDAVKVSETLCLAAEPTKGASVSRNEKSGFYRAVLNTCLSFLNEVKNLGIGCRSETPYPTNGSGKNPGRGWRY